MFIKTLKNKIVLVITANFAFLNSVNAGMPVIDSAGLAQSIMTYTAQVAQYAEEAQQWIAEKEQWVRQLTHYAEEIKAYEKQLEATSGIKDSIKNLTDLDKLFGDLEKIYTRSNDLLKNPINGSQKVFSKEWSQYMTYDRCQGLSGDSANACYANFSSMVSDLGIQNKAREFYKDKNENAVRELSTKIKISKDMKESSDLNNALLLELYQLQLQEAEKNASERAIAAQRELEGEKAWQRILEAQKTLRYDSSYLGRKD